MRPVSTRRKAGELHNLSAFFTRHTTKKFHLMNLSGLVKLLQVFLKVSGAEKRGRANARDIQLVEHDIALTSLPDSFDGFRILLITDLHLDGIPELHTDIIERVSDLNYDICILGGDYHFRHRSNQSLMLKYMQSLMPVLLNKTEVVGILGNHDDYAIGKKLDELGVEMLLNQSKVITRGDQTLSICGLDDCHYFGAHDWELTEENLPAAGCRILVCHSPELYNQAEQRGYHLYLAGHTHNGQICLPGRLPIIYEAKVPRRIVYGRWQQRRLAGYTSCGVGSSGLPVRFNCPPEVVILTLRTVNQQSLTTTSCKQENF